MHPSRRVFRPITSKTNILPSALSAHFERPMNWNKIALSSALALSCLTLSAPVASAQLKATLVADGFAAPLYLCSPVGDSARMFVVEQSSARIKIIAGGSVLATPFIDLGSIASGGGERGLLGLAFHPNYMGTGVGSGKFYVNYTDNSGDTVIREYSVSAGNPDVADAGSFTTMLSISQPFSNHNGGCIQFGPDGYLYVGTGDGGSGNDPGNRAQDITNQLLGKMLRLDVDAGAPYIPPSNPFVGISGDDEIWAYGMRNPWRFSFDRLTGDMWIGDVGQVQREEVDFEAAGDAGGNNYGWRCMEGTNCTGLSGCTCNAAGLVLPVDEYSHAGGRCSITGGYRYRGANMPNFFGRYFFADFCSDDIWSFDFDGTSISDKVNHETDIAIPGAVSITSFGEDDNGELYICDSSGGQIWLIEEECNTGTTNYCTGGLNSSGGSASIGVAGTSNIGDNNFSLTVSGAVPNIPGLFFYGPSQNSFPFGNGTLCVSGGVTRLPAPVITDSLGTATKFIDMTTSPAGSGPSQILDGSTWNFQFWYRDVAGGGDMFNTSDGIAVQFCN
ncbi:MAG: glucose/arabinose dehydrogenase [Planctomycetota bacterium]|jgi:glucose/arabinose dehydrogenase